MRVNEIVPQYGRFSVAPASFLDWRAQNSMFERLAAYQNGSATLTTPGGPERLQGALVSWNVFDLLGVAPCFALNTLTFGVMLVALRSMDPERLQPASRPGHNRGAVRAGTRDPPSGDGDRHLGRAEPSRFHGAHPTLC